MIAPNSLVRQKEEAQGMEEEGAGGQRKGGTTGIPTPGADAPIGPTWSGVFDVRSREKIMGGDVGFQSTGGAEGTRDQSYALTIGMEGATERRTKL